jgi:integral membrane protein
LSSKYLQGNLILLILTDPLERFRKIAFIEGLSFLLLLFISMPMKYYLGYASFSWYVGAAHGGLFILYILFAIEILMRCRINFVQFLRVLIASVIPFGTFFNDKMLKEQQIKFSIQ